MIDFEDLITDGYGGSGHIEVSDQYSDAGITFNNPIAIDFSKNMAMPGLARSGSKAIEKCYTGVCREPIDMKYGPPVCSVSIHVGYHTSSSGGFGQPREIDLIAYDETGAEITRSSMSMRSSAGPTPIEKKLTVKSKKDNISLARVSFRSNGNLQSDNRGLILDDVEFMRGTDNLEAANFGSTEYDAKALEGEVFYIPENSNILNMPDFSNLTFGGLLYVKSLNIKPQSSSKSFEGLNRSNWFAIRYGGKFNITDEGFYKFKLASDDGSQLLLDGDKIIENDGIHEFASKGGLIYLDKGVHEIEADYFQAEDDVGLQLFVTPPGGEENLLEFEYGAMDANIEKGNSQEREYLNGMINSRALPYPILAESPVVTEPYVGAMHDFILEAPAVNEAEEVSTIGSPLLGAAEEPVYGKYAFYSIPGRASIIINNNTYGNTAKTISLELGPIYKYKIEKSGFKPVNGTIKGPIDAPIQVRLIAKNSGN